MSPSLSHSLMQRLTHSDTRTHRQPPALLPPTSLLLPLSEGISEMLICPALLQGHLLKVREPLFEWLCQYHHYASINMPGTEKHNVLYPSKFLFN